MTSTARLSWRYGLGLDYNLRSNLFVGAEADLAEDFRADFPILMPMIKCSRRRTSRRIASYFHWLPVPQVALSVEFVYDRFRQKRGRLTSGGFPGRLVTYSVPFGVRYFHASGFFAGAGASLRQPGRGPSRGVSGRTG